MSLITYIEPINVATFFTGIGGLVILLVGAWIIYSIFKPVADLIRIFYNKEVRYEILEERFLNDIAKEKGIDLDEELIKKQVLRRQRKSFRRRIEEQIYEKMFGKENETP